MFKMEVISGCGECGWFLGGSKSDICDHPKAPSVGYVVKDKNTILPECPLQNLPSKLEKARSLFYPQEDTLIGVIYGYGDWEAVQVRGVKLDSWGKLVVRVRVLDSGPMFLRDKEIPLEMFTLRRRRPKKAVLNEITDSSLAPCPDYML